MKSKEVPQDDAGMMRGKWKDNPMWLKLKVSVLKEALLLLREKAGLAMLFIIPMVLVLIKSLLQDSTLKMLEEQHTPVLVINNFSWFASPFPFSTTGIKK